jgi:hypothetical protein
MVMELVCAAAAAAADVDTAAAAALGAAAQGCGLLLLLLACWSAAKLLVQPACADSVPAGSRRVARVCVGFVSTAAMPGHSAYLSACWLQQMLS